MKLLRGLAGIVCLLSCIAVSLNAAAPPYISYQGRLTDDTGNPVDTTENMTFTIYTDDGTYTQLWTEIHYSVQVTDGLFTVLLGQYVPITDVVFDGSPRLMGIRLAAGPESTPRIPIISVPYAINAQSADTAAYALATPVGDAGGGWVDDGDVVRLGDISNYVGIGTDAPSKKLEVAGNARVGGDLNIDGRLHLEGGTPTITSDMGYVHFDTMRVSLLGELRLGSNLMHRKMQVYTEGTADTIAFQATNLTGTAGAFRSGTSGFGYSALSAAIAAYSDGESIAGFFNSNGEGHAIMARSGGPGHAIYGTAADTGYAGYFEGGKGVMVDGDLESNGSLKLPLGAGEGLVLTSDASGVASWQAGASGSPWTASATTAYLTDTTMEAAIGFHSPLSSKKLSVQTSGTGANMALWARNATGTAAGFYAGIPGTFFPSPAAAVFAQSGGDIAAGSFDAAGDGIGLIASSSGLGASLMSISNGTGFSGYFTGGKGVKVEGDFQATGTVTLPSGASDGYVLTSDASGVASWQRGDPASPWIADGSLVSLSDTSKTVSIGDTTIYTDYAALSVEREGTGLTSALRVINTTGTAARFYSGGPPVSYTTTPAAIWASGAGNSYGGFFSGSGTGYGIHVTASGSGYAGYFSGPMGVWVDAPIRVDDTAYLAELEISGNAVIDGALDVTGSSTLDDLNATGDVVIGGITTIGYSTTNTNGQLVVYDNVDEVGLHLVNADRDITWPAGQSLQLGEWNGSTFTPRMRINSDGNVGVNSTAPDGALHVRGNSDGLALHLSAASADISWPTNNTLNMGTWNGATFDEHLRITAGGNVGIGVSSTPNILTVQQYSATDPIADSWGTYSSRRWKENIRPLQGSLDRVLSLRGVSYDWKETGEHDIGLIAEEVGQVVPEVVRYEENGVDAQSVDYARLTALLIEAVKELKSENEDLKRRLEVVEEAGPSR